MTAQEKIFKTVVNFGIETDDCKYPGYQWMLPMQIGIHLGQLAEKSLEPCTQTGRIGDLTFRCFETLRPALILARLLDNLEADEVIALVIAERAAQTAKWGEQHHPLSIWLDILTEEVGEMMEESYFVCTQYKPSKNFLTETIQVAAVLVQILEWLENQS